jgi:hypothetical protein
MLELLVAVLIGLVVGALVVSFNVSNTAREILRMGVNLTQSYERLVREHRAEWQGTLAMLDSLGEAIESHLKKLEEAGTNLDDKVLEAQTAMDDLMADLEDLESEPDDGEPIGMNDTPPEGGTT